MTFSVKENAHTVLLPAFAGTTLSNACKKFLDSGGKSILLGETREEYLLRHMSENRRKTETADTFQKVTSEAKSYSGDLLVAVDQEIGGIERLHTLVYPLPDLDQITSMGTKELEDKACQMACGAKALGVNCFLAPVLDVISGTNPWLQGRTVSVDPEIVAHVSAAFVRGVQRAGVAATAKHFPGFHNIQLDPAIETEAVVTESLASFEAGFIPFRKVLANQVEVVMVGPAIVQAFDPHKPALRSKAVIDMLKNDFKFSGLVLADDLDAKATLRQDPIEQVAIDAINAGCDWLLLADLESQLSDVAATLVDAVDNGEVCGESLAKSADKVRHLARKYRVNTD